MQWNANALNDDAMAGHWAVMVRSIAGHCSENSGNTRSLPSSARPA